MQGSRVRIAARCCVATALAIFASQSAQSAEQVELADLIEKVEPSVVRIDVKSEDGAGVGSGFVVDGEGIVVTNHHVISGAKEANVSFRDGQTAKVLGTLAMDPQRDIAILKIERSGLTALKLAAALPRKGESVVAFGAPRGLSFSASEGIVSAVREGKELADYAENLPGTWIQTTTPISPGNSGGPLVNRDGEVVAANTLASNFGAQNLNFSISSVDIAEVLKNAKTKQLVALSDGAAKTKPARRKTKKNELETKDIPKEKIEAYVKSAKDTYKEAVVDARKKMAEAKSTLSSMKTGIIGTIAAQAQQGGAGFVIVHVRGKAFYQYPNQKTKNEVVKQQQEVVKQCEDQFKQIENSKTGMLAYLTKAGPELEPKSVGDIGCVKEIPVMQIADPEEFRSFVSGLPVSVRGIKTETLASGTSLPGRLMYVCGTESLSTNIGVLNTYVLRELPEEALAEHLATLGIASASGDSVSASGGSVSASGGSEKSQAKTETKPVASSSSAASSSPAKPAELEFRTWSDKTGRHKIEAKLLDQSADKVVLKRRDGQIVTVPLAALSQDDLNHLKNVPTAAAP